MSFSDTECEALRLSGSDGLYTSFRQLPLEKTRGHHDCQDGREAIVGSSDRLYSTWSPIYTEETLRRDLYAVKKFDVFCSVQLPRPLQKKPLG